MSPAPASHGPRILELDALRGLGAVAVMLFHYANHYDIGLATWMLPWRRHSVSMFFVISGFVTFGTLNRSRALADFAVSRASRLFPVYWTAVLLTSLVTFFAARIDLLRPLGDILINLTMLQGFFQVDPVDGSYWTLAVELAFYVGMGLLWRCGLFRHIDLVVFGWLAVPWIWTYAPLLIGHEPSWTLGRLLIQTHVAWFMIGIAAFRWRAERNRHQGWIVAAALATIAGCYGVDALIVALPITIVILWAVLRGMAVLRCGPFVWLGTISYSLYLLHQNIGFVVIDALQRHGVHSNIAAPTAIAIVLLLASAVTYAIERPASRAIRSRWTRRFDRTCAARHTSSGYSRDFWLSSFRRSSSYDEPLT